MSSVNINLHELSRSISLKDAFDLLRMICKEKYESTSRSESSYSSDFSYQETLPRKFTLIRNYLKQNDTIEPRYFYRKCNDRYFNQGYTKFDWHYGICPRCLQVGPHTCCVSCKSFVNFCRCVFRCALAYPSRFKDNGEVETWAKCSFFCDEYNEDAFQEHFKIC